MAQHSDGRVALDLLRKYDRPGPRYTSYPTAVEFSTDRGEADYRPKLAEADAARDEALSLYVHLPFCQERCSFCGCNVVITPKHEVSVRYLDYLHREIDLLAEHLPNRRKVSQYHWGGGTPTYQTVAEMEALHRKISEHFRIEPDAEAAVEVDPRATSFEQLAVLKDLGFNRVSMGIQDFSPEVQAAINRGQTEQQTRTLHAECRRLGFHSVNMDLVYGLPLQSAGPFSNSVDTTIELRPDRVALYSYAHVPWIRAHQKRIDDSQLPSADEKLKLFCIAREKFLEAGYVQIGMDHFALPGDELATAMQHQRLHRNFMGYTVRCGTDMVGVGTSAIGDIRGAMFQNATKLSDYFRAVDEGRLPVIKGYVLDDDDRIRRAVIMQLMCNFHLNRKETESELGIELDTYFAPELAELTAADGPVDHGFLKVDAEGLEVVGDGRLFIRNICMVFDRYLRDAESRGSPVFSRTV